MTPTPTFSDEAIKKGYHDIFQTATAPGTPSKKRSKPKVPPTLKAAVDDAIQPFMENGNAQDHLQEGWSLLLEGKYSKAEARYRAAIRQNPESPAAYLGLGIALARQGHHNKARAAYERALRLRPKYPAALVHLGYVYADGPAPIRNVRKARHFFQQAVSQGDPLARIALIDLSHRQ